MMDNLGRETERMMWALVLIGACAGGATAMIVVAVLRWVWR